MFTDGNKDQPCMSCGAVLFSNARLNGSGHISVNTLTQIQLQQVDDDLYFKCQKCDAKNFVELETGSNGLPQLKLTHVEP